jgi:hypothetical protein
MAAAAHPVTEDLMTQFRLAVVASLLLVGACFAPDHARSQSVIAAPGTSGDQLLFFYDATAGRTPFLVVSNLSPSELTLEIAWYAQDLSQRVATQRQTLSSGGNVVLDPSQIQGVAGNAGITVVTPLVESGTEDQRPVVPQPLNDTLASAPTGPLAGGFTLADLSSNSAFGQNPLARVAVTADGKRAAPGSIVDGTTVRYQRIAPDALVIPFYFNPSTAGFANRAILGAFEDRYSAASFSIGPATVELNFGLVDASGADVGSGSLGVTGVAFTDVQSLAGTTPLTSSGKVLFSSETQPLPENANLLGLMSQSLGTFAVGQGLPGYFSSQEEGRFVDNGDGTVTDRETGLQWEQKVTGSEGQNLDDPHDVDNRYSWSASDTAPDGTAFTDFLVKLNGGPTGVGDCVVSGDTQTGGFAGHCDWRLPTIAELQTIVDTAVSGCGGGSPCIDPTFGPTAADRCWSASTSAADARFALIVDFSDGSEPSFFKADPPTTSARAVRGGS